MVVNRGYSVVCGLLIRVASSVAELRILSVQASVVVTY